ncbi:LapA family protein [Thermosulfuriphilus sp.]
MEFYLILAAIIAVAIALFAIQNASPVVVSFLFWRFESSLAVVIILAITAGIAITWLITIPSRIRRRRELSERNKRVEELERRLRELEELLAKRAETPSSDL